MRYTAAAVLIGLFVWTAAAQEKPADGSAANTLTDAEKAAGFKLLFDGKTTEGWRGYKKQTCPDGWKVEGGALVRAARAGDIITKDEYESFELLIDWKVAAGANSGIFYHVAESAGPSYSTGPEVQVLDNARHADGRNPLTSAGSCYALYAPAKDVTKPVGEWNTMKLIVNGKHVEHWLNGEKIVEYEKGSDEWNEKVAHSKFKDMPNFGKPTKGHICIQDHGDRVEFRNIKIRVIHAEAK
jgi:hypothetical protein